MSVVSEAPVAAIDCGTNSTRLLVAAADGTTLDRRMIITRLGAGVDATRQLDPLAIERTVGALRDFRAAMDEHGVTRVRMTATSAARDASNRSEFFGPAADVIGVVPELLTGDEEGRLSFTGAVRELVADDGPFLVADIGGGSTELIVGAEEPTVVESLELGCVRLTEQFFAEDPPAPEELSAAVQHLRDVLEDVRRRAPEVNDARQFVGLAGTVSAMAAIEIGLPAYDRERIHHFVLTKAAAEDVFRTVATEALSDRVHNPGLERDRADVIVGGAVILVSIMRVFGFNECLVSEADILDGLVMSLLT